MPVRLPAKGQKKDLLAMKETLLKEISYLDRSIEQLRNNADKSNSLEMEYSSDSDVELSLQDCGPSVVQLKLEQSMLQTRLQATNELSGLNLLQHEVNVLVTEPASLGASAVKEPGLWREVTAECSIDLVQFSITFLTHQPNRKFSPASYHGLRVVPLKRAHEAELSASVLPGLKTPSDAVEVLAGYAAAYRSRRSTMARLADRFGKVLHMEPVPEGGYLLKCADLLELSWTLQNKWSSIAPFQHKMKFDLEYMDEQHLKIITQAHRQLIEPAVDTDERTLLLAKIIETCLKVKYGNDGVNYEQVLESEVMAPPKSLPKKVKSKKKENASAISNTSESTQQRAAKRSVADESDSHNKGAKKMKAKDSTNSTNSAAKESIANVNQGKTTEQVESSVNDNPEKSVATDKPKKSVATSKNKVKSASDKPNVNGDAKTITDETAKRNAKQNSGKTTEQNANNVAVEKANVENKTVKSTNSKSNVDSLEKGKNEEVVTSGKDVNDPKPSIKSVEKVKQVKKSNDPQTSKANANNDNRRGTFVVAGSVASVNDKPSINKEKKQAQNINGYAQQNIGNKENSAKKVNKNVNSVKPYIKKVINNKNSENKTTQKPTETKKVDMVENGGSGRKVDKNVIKSNNLPVKALNKPNVAKHVAVNKDNESRIPKNTATKSSGSIKNQNGDNSSKHSDRNTSGIPKPLKPNVNKISKSVVSAVKPTKLISTNLKRVNSGNIEKENIQKQKISNVPRMKTSTPKMVKKVPLRISPRKPMSKKPLVGSNTKNLSKPVSSTNIPRLMAKKDH